MDGDVGVMCREARCREASGAVYLRLQVAGRPSLQLYAPRAVDGDGQMGRAPIVVDVAGAADSQGDVLGVLKSGDVDVPGPVDLYALQRWQGDVDDVLAS